MRQYLNLRNALILLLGFGILLLALFLGSKYWDRTREIEAPEPELPEERVQLYFRYADRMRMKSVKREVPEAKDATERIRQVIEQLKVPPSDTVGNSVLSLPDELELRSVFIGDQIIYLDFNDRFVNLAEGINSEILILYSIVNTVLQNAPDEKRLVYFLIEGEMRKTIGQYGEESGHVSIRYPLGPRWNLVE